MSSTDLAFTIPIQLPESHDLVLPDACLPSRSEVSATDLVVPSSRITFLRARYEISMVLTCCVLVPGTGICSRTPSRCSRISPAAGIASPYRPRQLLRTVRYRPRLLLCGTEYRPRHVVRDVYYCPMRIVLGMCYVLSGIIPEPCAVEHGIYPQNKQKDAQSHDTSGYGVPGMRFRARDFALS